MWPRVCLLDAGPVIELHRLGLWEAVAERVHLAIPSIVVEREAEFWDSGEGIGKPINLEPFIQTGAVKTYEVAAESMAAIQELFDPSFAESIHAGELEALAILHAWGNDPPGFCTGDRLATVALCLLGHSDLAVSLEQLLDEVGLSHQTRKQFRRKTMETWVEDGVQRRLRGEGLW